MTIPFFQDFKSLTFLWWWEHWSLESSSWQSKQFRCTCTSWKTEWLEWSDLVCTYSICRQILLDKYFQKNSTKTWFSRICGSSRWDKYDNYVNEIQNDYKIISHGYIELTILQILILQEIQFIPYMIFTKLMKVPMLWK